MKPLKALYRGLIQKSKEILQKNPKEDGTLPLWRLGNWSSRDPNSIILTLLKKRPKHSSWHYKNTTLATPEWLSHYWKNSRGTPLGTTRTLLATPESSRVKQTSYNHHLHHRLITGLNQSGQPNNVLLFLRPVYRIFFHPHDDKRRMEGIVSQSRLLFRNDHHSSNYSVSTTGTSM